MVDSVGYKTSTQSATVAATSADASATVLYTCPAKHSASVDMLFLSNNNAGAKKISVQHYDSESATYNHIAKVHSIAANSSFNLLGDSQMHLQSGDKIVFYAETTNTIESTISVKEYYNPNR